MLHSFLLQFLSGLLQFLLAQTPPTGEFGLATDAANSVSQSHSCLACRKDRQLRTTERTRNETRNTSKMAAQMAQVMPGPLQMNECPSIKAPSKFSVFCFFCSCAQSVKAFAKETATRKDLHEALSFHEIHSPIVFETGLKHCGCT